MSPGQNEFVAECKAMQMSPSKQRNGELIEWDDVVKRITEDGFREDFLEGGEKKKILVFLYGREYFKEDESRRKADVKKMLEMDLLVKDKAKDTPRKRILTVIEHETDVTEKLETFDADLWKDLIKGYGEHTIFKMFEIEMVQRIQRSGNSFLHAPAVLQGYLVQKGSGEWKGMMNLAKYVRNCFTSKKFSTYIIADGGASSLDALTDILEDNLEETNNLRAKNMDLALEVPKLLKYLKQYGPALVALFGVDEEFMGIEASGDNNIPYVSHTIILGKHTKRHAMVLVGMRRVKNEKNWRLLLQNWWPGSQLIEVSSETFASSGAIVHFARKKQTVIKDEIPTLANKQAETFAEGCAIPEKRLERQFLSAGTVH
jgi:hypothetical protein